MNVTINLHEKKITTWVLVIKFDTLCSLKSLSASDFCLHLSLCLVKLSFCAKQALHTAHVIGGFSAFFLECCFFKYMFYIETVSQCCVSQVYASVANLHVQIFYRHHTSSCMPSSCNYFSKLKLSISLW